MNLEMLRASDYIQFECIGGSVSYGTNTKDSDIDIRGVFIYPNEMYLTLTDPVEQVGDETNDVIFYSMKRFFELAMTSNPNILELLFMPEDCIKVCSPLMQRLIDNRKLFISKKAYYTHIQYAYSQTKRAKGVNKWINNPKPVEPPDRMDFCWVFPFQKAELTGDSKINNELIWFDKFMIGQVRGYVKGNEQPFRPIPVKESYLDLSQCNCAALEHVENAYRLYHYGEQARGVFRNNQLAVESIPMDDEWTRFCGLMIYNEDAYKKAFTDWKNYWTWKKERNEARYRSQEAGEIDYDCYLDKETEFLTINGWKKYDEIQWYDKLATLNPKTHEIEYQKFTDRFCKPYTGKIFAYENRYTRFAVTPNHKLFVSDCYRQPKNKFSTKYNESISNWHFLSVADYFSGNRSYKNIVVSSSNNQKDFYMSDDYISLMGAYLSEGTINFNKSGTPQAVYISQLEGGRICNIMENIKEFEVRRTIHNRKNRNEITYRIQNQKLATEFYSLMGHGCHYKKFPDFVRFFSKRQFMLLLEAMMSGDGHKHPKGHCIYYSSCKELIEQLQFYLFSNGMASQIYNKSERSNAYQLFISKDEKQYINMNKDSCWQEISVENEKVVCFTVPNSILITRNNGKISIQGNSKNIMHTVRLLWSGRNILVNGEPIVRFTGDQLQFLKDIRAGKFTYDYLIEMVEKEMKDMEELKEKSSIPDEVNKKALEALYKLIISID